MPTYSYECNKCGHIFDIFHAMSQTPRIKCEKCGARCQRLIGTGAGIIFKGSGFYETDFKDKKGKPPAKESKPETESVEKTEAKSGTDSAAKSASKATASTAD